MQKKAFTIFVFLLSSFNSDAQVADAISLAEKLTGVADQLDVLVNIDQKMESLEKIEKTREALKQASNYYNDVKYISNIVTLVETTACSLRDLDETMDMYYDMDNLKDKQACFTGIDYEYIVAQGQTIDDMLKAIMEKNTYSDHERDVIGKEVPEKIKTLSEDIKTLEKELLHQMASSQRIQWEQESHIDKGASSIQMDFVETDINDARGLIFLFIKIALGISLVPVISSLTRGNSNHLYIWIGALLMATLIERIIT